VCPFFVTIPEQNSFQPYRGSFTLHIASYLRKRFSTQARKNRIQEGSVGSFSMPFTVPSTIPRRRPREDLRQLLLNVGAQIITEEGLRGGVSGVTFTKVFEIIFLETGEQIAPGSVYKRIWDDQRAFQLDVLCQAAQAYPREGVEHKRHVARATKRAMTKIDPTDTRAAIKALCEATAYSVLELLQNSRSWLVWMAVYACTASTPELDDDDAVLEEILGGFKATEMLFEPLIETLRTLGVTPRDAHAEREFIIDAAAAAEGTALRSNFVPFRSEHADRNHQNRRRDRAKDFFADALEGLVIEDFTLPTKTRNKA
jgi:hypothetical protein